MTLKSYVGDWSEDGMELSVNGKLLDGGRYIVVDWSADPATVLEQANAILRGLGIKSQFVQIDTASDSYIFYLK